MRRRLAGAIAGIAASAVPAAAVAQTAADRSLDAPSDAGIVTLLTLLGVAAVFVAAAVGYLYRRKRGLEWRFQLPDEPHDEHH